MFHGSRTLHAPRPCVNANRYFCPSVALTICSHIVTAGPNPVSSASHVRPASIDDHHAEIGAQVEPLRIVWIDDDRVDRDVGQGAGAAAGQRLPRLAVVGAAIHVRAAEVAVGGIDDAPDAFIVRDGCHPAVARPRVVKLMRVDIAGALRDQRCRPCACRYEMACCRRGETAIALTRPPSGMRRIDLRPVVAGVGAADTVTRRQATCDSRSGSSVNGVTKR